MIVTANDIRKRMYDVSYNTPQIKNYDNVSLYTESGVFCTNNVINKIKNWRGLDENSNIAFDKALDAFEELFNNNAPKGTINSCTSHLVEAVSKVRDAESLKRSLKNRMGRIRNSKAIAKINQVNDVVSNAISGAIANINNDLTKNAIKPMATNNGQSANESFLKLYEASIRAYECDRIIKNYNSITRRFNLDKYVDNNYQDLYETAMVITSCLDTYDTPFRNKYNSALETINYLYSKHHLQYPNDKIVEAVTDYFIFNGILNETKIADVNYVIKNSVMFTDTDFDCFTRIFKPETVDITDTTVNPEDYGIEDIAMLSEADLVKTIKDKAKSIKNSTKKLSRDITKAAKEGNPEEHRDEDVKKMVDDFRKSCIQDKDNKTNLTRFKSLIKNIFSKTPYQIVYELPNLFSILRASFIIGATAINPVLGVITLITNEMVKIGMTRKQTDKAIAVYEKEIKTIKDKIKNCKNEEDKSNFEKYLKELEKDLDKIEMYARDIYTDEENDQRDEDKYARNAESNDSDDDFGLDDWDDDDDWDFEDFEELGKILYTEELMQSISEALLDTDIDGIVYNNIFKLSNDSIDTITDLSVTVPVILEKEKLNEAFIEHRAQLRFSSDAKDYIRIDCLNNNIARLESVNPVYNTSHSIDDAIGYLTCIDEMVKMSCSEDIVLEMNFTNTLKLAINNLKKKAIKLSDKEKQMSSQLDASINGFAKSIEKAVENDNKEAVIRGSIIPSASKCVKMALATGATWMINPAMAVIGVLGWFFSAKKMQHKERQLALDEIEVELKMCERYIQQAENKNDMKALRQYEMIQRNLIRQQQRIKYKMKLYTNDNVPDIKHD